MALHDPYKYPKSPQLFHLVRRHLFFFLNFLLFSSVHFPPPTTFYFLLFSNNSFLHAALPPPYLHLFPPSSPPFPSFVSSSLFNYQLFPLFASPFTSLFINLTFFPSSSKFSPLGLLPFHSPPPFSLAHSLRLFFSPTSYFVPRLSFTSLSLFLHLSFLFLFSSPLSYSSFSILPIAILLFLPLLFVSFSLLRILFHADDVFRIFHHVFSPAVLTCTANAGYLVSASLSKKQKQASRL